MSLEHSELQRTLRRYGRVVDAESLQRLWSGYGDLLRVSLKGGPFHSLIVKQIEYPQIDEAHPHGWAGAFSHQRKLRSYEVEACWYEHYASKIPPECKCPLLILSEHTSNGLWLVLEDLGANYPITPDRIHLDQVRVCLRWLAHFHAGFLHADAEGLWPTGTYWHLDTRPDEHQVMPEGELKQFAHRIDERLSQTRYPTLVHGDAKLANFCFSDTGDRVAAVDFQYVGRGCGMKDVVYFLTSCLDENACFAHADALLNDYFVMLSTALEGRFSPAEFEALETEWRGLYPLAWADFKRFLDGWSPDHWKLNRYMAHQTELALKDLQRSEP